MAELENSKDLNLIYDEKPESLKVALETYIEALEDESAEELKIIKKYMLQNMFV